jgi:hypothetical protein
MARIFAVPWECLAIRRHTQTQVPFAAIQRLLISNVKLLNHGHPNALHQALSVPQSGEGVAVRMVQHVQKMAVSNSMEAERLHRSPPRISL